jgi:hypothetical protein
VPLGSNALPAVMIIFHFPLMFDVVLLRRLAGFVFVLKGGVQSVEQFALLHVHLNVTNATNG